MCLAGTHGVKVRAMLDEVVEQSLRKRHLDETKDRLKQSALAIRRAAAAAVHARALASPEVLLKDEPPAPWTPSPPSR